MVCKHPHLLLQGPENPFQYLDDTASIIISSPGAPVYVIDFASIQVEPPLYLMRQKSRMFRFEHAIV